MLMIFGFAIPPLVVYLAIIRPIIRLASHQPISPNAEHTLSVLGWISLVFVVEVVVAMVFCAVMLLE